jgi:hypothetical protein
MPPATAGWQQQTGKPQPQIAIHRPVSRLFFFLSLPTFDETTTDLHLQAQKLTETVLQLNLGHFVGFFVLFCAVLFYFIFPLWWDNYTIWGTISRTGGWGTNTKIIRTETLLHLNLEIFFYIYFFLIIYFFLFLFFNFLFSILSLSL